MKIRLMGFLLAPGTMCSASTREASSNSGAYYVPKPAVRCATGWRTFAPKDVPLQWTAGCRSAMVR